MSPQQKQQSLVNKQGGWAQFIVKWVVAAVAAILITVGAVNLVKTIYKSTLDAYPVDRGFGPSQVRFAAPGEKATVVPETDEEKKDRLEREQEARVLSEINDYATSAGQLLAGLGLWYVFLLIVKKGE